MARIATGGTRGRRMSLQAAAFVASLACALVFAAPPRALATDAVFTVANYPVDARADNAVSAKEKALSEGQQAAFRSLLKRLVPVSAYARVRKLSAVRAGDLVEGVRVRSERNSATEYIASLDFSFQARAVRDLLRREGIPFSDEQAPTLTVVPVWRGGPADQPKDDAAWTGIWKGLDLEHALTPVNLQVLRREIQPSTINALASGDGTAMRALVGAYRSEHIIIALAEPDVAAKRLNVILSGRDAVGAFTLRRAYRLDPGDPGYTSELAAVVALRVIEGRWKAVKSQHGTEAAGGGSADMLISVEFRGMSEWQDISRKLAATPGVEELEVAGLSARGARVTLRYVGGAERLADALARQGLALRSAGGNWLVTLQ